MKIEYYLKLKSWFTPMNLKYRKKKKQEIAIERIKTLHNLILNCRTENIFLRQRYAEIARKIAMRARLHMPKEINFFICKSCKRLLIPAYSSRFRIQAEREKHLTITCLICGKIKRINLRKKKQLQGMEIR
jgi:ribonuclease P protein subunit RPR2